MNNASQNFAAMRQQVQVQPKRASISATQLEKQLSTGTLTKSAALLYDMHCVSLDDVLNFKKIPNFDEVQKMGKHVVVTEADRGKSSRPILFISHQWNSYSHPDPSNRKFEILQGALRSMRNGKIIRGSDIHAGQKFTPKPTNYAPFLKNALVFMDYFSVPQLKARHQDETTAPNPEEEIEDDETKTHRLHEMLLAVNSIPAYIQMSSLMLVLAPTIQHREEGTDCQFSTWKRRGWCLLEQIVSALVHGSGKNTVIIQTADTISLALHHASDILAFTSVGDGNFSCCARNHVVLVDGIETSIPCDKQKVATVLATVVEQQLQLRSREKDLANYRWLLAHRHTIYKNLDVTFPTYDTWESFAKAYHLDESQPLKKCGGKHNFKPIAYAVMSQSVPVVNHLVSLKADVNEVLICDKRSGSYNKGMLHIIMARGHGQDGRDVFDALIHAGADPYQYGRVGTWFGKSTCFDPLALARAVFNFDMCLYYMSKVKPNFHGKGETSGIDNANYVCHGGHYDLAMECVKQGATFDGKNKHGMGFMAIYSFAPKEFVWESNCKVLDEFHSRGLLGDLNVVPHHTHFCRTVLLFRLVWSLRHIALVRKHPQVNILYAFAWGTYLHMAVLRDKPELVVWLLNNGADPKRRNLAKQTPLDLAQELGHVRCVSILTGDKSMIRRYSHV